MRRAGDHGIILESWVQGHVANDEHIRRIGQYSVYVMMRNVTVNAMVT
jgi:hypothetical protein